MLSRSQAVAAASPAVQEQHAPTEFVLRRLLHVPRERFVRGIASTQISTTITVSNMGHFRPILANVCAQAVRVATCVPPVLIAPMDNALLRVPEHSALARV